jgi:hypothetical protein
MELTIFWNGWQPGPSRCHRYPAVLGSQTSMLMRYCCWKMMWTSHRLTGGQSPWDHTVNHPDQPTNLWQNILQLWEFIIQRYIMTDKRTPFNRKYSNVNVKSITLHEKKKLHIITMCHFFSLSHAIQFNHRLRILSCVCD